MGVACTEPVQEPTSLGDEWVPPQGHWVESWRDDFDGTAGGVANPLDFSLETNDRPVNGELQYYTTRRDNSFLDGNGHLVIRARKEEYQGRSYTSARLSTGSLIEARFGRIEARIKLPVGKGIWPAFWLLGSNVADVGWPDCGEIDITELAASRASSVSGSLHGPGFSGTGALSRPFQLESGTFADDFHLFALEWAAGEIRWLVDEEPYHVRTREGLARLGKSWVFDGPFFIVINLAVGGNFDGPPDGTTSFPADMIIDSVHIVQMEANTR